MKKTLSLGLTIVYLMMPCNTFAQTNNETTEIDEFVDDITKYTS